MIFPHHIYCTQSKVKWGGGANGGGGHGVNGGTIKHSWQIKVRDDRKGPSQPKIDTFG